MEISIKLDFNDKWVLDYEVNINGEKFKINTTWVVQNVVIAFMAFNAFMALKNSIVVGLCADRIHGYTGGRCKGIYPFDPFSNYSLKFKPYNLWLIINWTVVFLNWNPKFTCLRSYLHIIDTYFEKESLSFTSFLDIDFSLYVCVFWIIW